MPGRSKGFFDIPLDNLISAPVFVKDIIHRYGNEGLVIVSPDVGGVVRARMIAKRLDADHGHHRQAAGTRRRVRGHERHRRREAIGAVSWSTTSSTAAAPCATRPLHCWSTVRSRCSAYCTHGVLSSDAVARVEHSPMKELVITDSIEATEAVRISTVVQAN